MSLHQTGAAAYKNQQIMTASPEELTLLLYNGAIKFVNEAINAIEKNDWSKATASNLRTQDIVNEFMRTLDMKYEISKGYFQLYEYIRYCLIQGVIKRDKRFVEEARTNLIELRDVWFQAMKSQKTPKAAAR
jgi:flagellar protein FliS